MADQPTELAPPIGLPERYPDPELARRYDSALGLVGNTPLVRINRLTAGLPGEVYVKLDHYNAGGSSKDRIGLNIVRTAIADGTLKPGDRIIDFGIGNTAIGYALAGIATGHPVTIVVNQVASPEKVSLLRFLGADVLQGRHDVPRDDPENWAAIAKRYADEDPATWWAAQESNGSNPAAHIASTGPELWAQTEGRITHFLAALATGGTASGTGEYLKGRKPEVEIVATDFAESPNGSGQNNLARVITREPGWETLERNWVPNVNPQHIDRLEIRPRAEVIDFAWRVARTEGLVLGLSSVLSLKVAVELAAKVPEGSVIVSFSADSSRDYVSREYNIDWLRANELGHIADKYVNDGAGDDTVQKGDLGA